MAHVYEDFPLDKSGREIRLIRLQPRLEQYRSNTPEAEIQCHIFQVSLDENPIYTAVSYVWGNSRIKKQIMLKNALFDVTENLHSALQHLRRDTEELTIWVDAICINQMDNHEKSWQVQQMRNVYEQADQVMVWLGPASDDSDRAMRKLKTFGERVKHHNILKWWELSYRASLWGGIRIENIGLAEGDSTVEEILSSLSVSDDDDADVPVTPVLAILSRAWWQRVWVLQEFALAKDTIFSCGTETIKADSLSAALTAFRLYHQVITGTLYSGPHSYVPIDFDSRPYMMLSTRRTDHLGFIKLPLSVILQVVGSYTRQNRRLQATDPRDMIYALLGLTSDAEHHGIYPDYSKPCWQVYSEVAKVFMELNNGPKLLSLCYFPKQRMDLPSWVPDWSAISQNRQLPLGYEFGPEKTIWGNVMPPFASSGAIPYGCEPRIDDLTVFCLKGAIIDTIKESLKDDVKSKFESQLDSHRGPSLTNWTERKSLVKPYAGNSLFVPLGDRLEDWRSISEDQVTIEPAITIGQKLWSPTPPDIISVKRINFDLTLEYIDIAHGLAASVRKLIALNRAVYLDRPSEEEAIWRTLVADQMSDKDDKWHRPTKDHYYLHLLNMRMGRVEVPQELRLFMDRAIMQRAFDKLQEWDIFDDLEMDVVRVLFYGSQGQPFQINRKERSELIPKLFALGAMADLEVTPEQYLEAAKTEQPPFDTGDYLNRLMSLVAKAFEVPDEDGFKQDFAELSIPIESYLFTIRSLFLGRNVFVTEKGYLGLGPQHLQAGDVVSIIPGAEVPVILRPGEKGRYQLVGEAYVHGIMNGEALTQGCDMEVIELY